MYFFPFSKKEMFEEGGNADIRWLRMGEVEIRGVTCSSSKSSRWSSKIVEIL